MVLLPLTMLAAHVHAQSPAPAEPFTGIAPLDPQPAADAMEPGLAVKYYYEKFYTLSDMDNPESEPEDGPPLPLLDHDTDDGNVLTSDAPMLVGALIRGAIRFPEAGTYTLRFVTNDGVRIWLGGVQIFEDPDIHADRSSPPLPVTIDSPGYYEFKIDYYQKKGTSALQAYWTPPGGTEAVIPADAFSHPAGG